MPISQILIEIHILRKNSFTNLILSCRIWNYFLQSVIISYLTNSRSLRFPLYPPATAN